jgi:hypothetical protein
MIAHACHSCLFFVSAVCLLLSLLLMMSFQSPITLSGQWSALTPTHPDIQRLNSKALAKEKRTLTNGSCQVSLVGAAAGSAFLSGCLVVPY